MKAFADLYSLLDETTKTTAKVRALREYFAHAPAEDAAWAVFFLIGRKPRQVVRSGKLRTWAAEAAGIPTMAVSGVVRRRGRCGRNNRLALAATRTVE